MGSAVKKRIDIRVCDDCGGDMYPYGQYLFHTIEEGFVCSLCGYRMPVIIKKRSRTKYAFITDYVRLKPLPKLKRLSADSHQPIAKNWKVA